MHVARGMESVHMLRLTDITLKSVSISFFVETVVEGEWIGRVSWLFYSMYDNHDVIHSGNVVLFWTCWVLEMC